MKMRNNQIVDFYGNKEIMEQHKTAFLCSSKYSSKSVLRSYDWAKEQRDVGNCVISGFHSIIEKDVFEILLRGIQPIILVLARGMLKRIPENLQLHIEAGRLLIITPFETNVTRVTKETAAIRNRLCISLADKITIAHLTKGGQLDALLSEVNDKEIYILDRS